MNNEPSSKDWSIKMASRDKEHTFIEELRRLAKEHKGSPVLEDYLCKCPKCNQDIKITVKLAKCKIKDIDFGQPVWFNNKSKILNADMDAILHHTDEDREKD